jgi:hypothetical protein
MRLVHIIYVLGGGKVKKAAARSPGWQAQDLQSGEEAGLLSPLALLTVQQTTAGRGGGGIRAARVYATERKENL